MSKSLGNVVEPEKIIKQYGSEVLRLWMASVEFYEDVRVSDTILTRLSEAYRKLCNTFRYALGNLADFDAAKDALPGERLRELDQWILLRAEALAGRCRKWYGEFAFHKIYHAVYDFATVDLSAIYFDILKDRLYTAAPRSEARRSAQTALYRLAHALVRLLAPILTFTCEEVWGYLQLPGSVHTALFPAPDELSGGIPEERRQRLGDWDRLMEARAEVRKSLETARRDKLIGAPLEAQVRLAAGDDWHPLLHRYAAGLAGLFIVSSVVLEHRVEAGIGVAIERAPGAKCERCWKYVTDLGANPELPAICGPCAEAVVEITAARQSAG
jgi:isoleucyl-tRNA synthetase